MFSLKICYEIYQEQGMLLLPWVKNRLSFWGVLGQELQSQAFGIGTHPGSNPLGAVGGVGICGNEVKVKRGEW